MPDATASRTLVKSAPELWTECSDADSLGRHLDSFGDIRITRLEPETAVAWEGELASGTVRLEPSGWGTRVVLTATPAPSPAGAEAVAATAADVPEAGEVSPEPAEVAAASGPMDRVADPDPVAVADAVATPGAMGSGPEVERGSEPEPVRRPGFFARLFGRYRGRPEALVEPEAPVAPVAPVVPAEALEPEPEVIAIAAAPEPVAVEPEPGAPEPEASDAGGPDPEAVLVAALDSLGQAHHRPYSRA